MPAHILDPITLSTVWHNMQSYCREMKHVITRTAQSILIAHLGDVSVGIWDRDGRTVAVPTGLPSQFLGGKYTIRYLLEHFGDRIAPGDVYLCNDVYKGYGNHLPDWAFIRPIFHEGRLCFFTLARAHMYDTGGAYPGGYFPNAYDIIAEGLNIPPVKFLDQGRENEDLHRLIYNNVRWPEAVRVDNLGMIAATTICERRLQGLMKKYGVEVVEGCIQEMFQRTERFVRGQIRQIPDGTYTAEAGCDDDGTVLDEPVYVRLDMTVAGDALTLDFSRSDGQRKGFVNSTFTAVYSQAVASVFLFLDPAIANYHNEGSMTPITVVNPAGRVTNAQWPCTVGAAPITVGSQVMESVLMALSQAFPKRAIAPWARHYRHYMFGPDPRTGDRYVQSMFEPDGGAGAVWGYDGFEGAASITTLGEVARANVEEMEVRVPWWMLHYEFAEDSPGAGRWRGACGVRWAMRNDGGEAKMSTGNADAEVVVPKGVAGGGDCPPNRCWIVRGDQRTLAKVHRYFDLQPGDIIEKLSGGGAGVGNPAERDPEAVREDVLDGILSHQTARDVYRVDIDRATNRIVRLLEPRRG